ncbi:hypothetical protein [Streptomyces sp. AC154]|uniref:hypothetical protein n=1 Tax=Streptomyces sp. AC154 TaxID=3143184 RepID=UPI003F7F4BBE
MESSYSWRLVGELKNFDTMVKAYCTADVYPVYRYQSAYSHTMGGTADDAFLIMDGDTLKFTTEPKGGAADTAAERLWSRGLAAGSRRHQPLLVGDFMKPTIDKAMGDLGLPGSLLNLRRTRPLM